MIYRIGSQVRTNYPNDRRVYEERREREERGGCALESFRDERERAFRGMVHYQGQYPGCSTTLLTISPDYYTLYLPRSPLSYFPLSPFPLALVLEALSPPSATITFVREFPRDSQSQIDKEDVVSATSSRRSRRGSRAVISFNLSLKQPRSDLSSSAPRS